MSKILKIIYEYQYWFFLMSVSMTFYFSSSLKVLNLFLALLLNSFASDTLKKETDEEDSKFKQVAERIKMIFRWKNKVSDASGDVEASPEGEGAKEGPEEVALEAEVKAEDQDSARGSSDGSRPTSKSTSQKDSAKSDAKKVRWKLNAARESRLGINEFKTISRRSTPLET